MGAIWSLLQRHEITSKGKRLNILKSFWLPKNNGKLNTYEVKTDVAQS
jgi:hypothetical protein